MVNHHLQVSLGKPNYVFSRGQRDFGPKRELRADYPFHQASCAAKATYFRKDATTLRVHWTGKQQKLPD